MRYFLLLQGMIGERLFKKEETACGVWLLEEGKYIVAVETNKDMVYRIALHDCRNRHDAEDIMQIVFLKLYRSAVAFESPEHLKNWLIRVTVNECRRMYVSPWKKHEECREYLPRRKARPGALIQRKQGGIRRFFRQSWLCQGNTECRSTCIIMRDTRRRRSPSC